MSAPSSGGPSLWEAFKIWSHIGLLSFGGPAAQISMMHRILVEEKKWLTEQQYLNALSFCMLLPGPEAMQLATYTGWRMQGIIGGLMAGLLFVVPGAIVILALALMYAYYGATDFMATLFLGIKSVVVIIVIEALLRMSRKSLDKMENWLVAGFSFVAIFFLALPFPLIILVAGLYGYVRLVGKDALEKNVQLPKLRKSFSTIVTWLLIWLVPLFALTFLLGQEHILSEIGWFFSKLAVVTFGGAYAVLAYMGQEVVTTNGWLAAGQMMDGLGLAETTPGPLILVTEFVGFLAAFQHAGSSNLSMGIWGASITLWATFAPCFLWIFAGAPYIEWLNSQPRLKGALLGIAAAVVGVIFNLSLWFALHVFFGDVARVEIGFLKLWIPDLVTLDGHVVFIALVSGYFLLRRHWNIPVVLTLASAMALLLAQLP